jgi:hypothetical protein
MKKYFLLSLLSFGVLCLLPAADYSARACDKKAFTCIAKAIDPVNIYNAAAEEEDYSSGIMIYPLNHF